MDIMEGEFSTPFSAVTNQTNARESSTHKYTCRNRVSVGMLAAYLLRSVAEQEHSKCAMVAGPQKKVQWAEVPTICIKVAMLHA